MSIDPLPSSPSPFDHIKAPNWIAGGVGQVSAPASQSFRDFHLSQEIYDSLDAVGYQSPTPVQASCMPLILAGIDLIVQSQTGTGKTAAFAIPAIEMLESGTCRVEVLVLAPTRELAKQVGGEFERLGAHKNIPVACVYGGTGFQQQLDDLKTAQVVCATPGRLLDLLKRRAMTLEHLKLFILDEADEMLNMGFEKELTAIVERLPESRQSLLFSATVGEEIQNLAGHILDNPEYITLSSDQVAAEEVYHAFYRVSGMGRLWDLTRIIEHENPESAIVFCNTREDSFLVANFLKKQGYTAEVLNGDLPQADREETLGKLREGQIRFLVATDVAARGIDISDLSHVLNYTLPDSPETYIHRTGRTGRAGKQGVALSLISPREIGTWYILRRVFKMELAERQLPSPEDITLLQSQRAWDDLTQRLSALDAADAHLADADRILAAEDVRGIVARLLAAFEKSVKATLDTGEVDEAALRARPAGAPRVKEVVKAAAPAPRAPRPAPPVVEAAPEVAPEPAPVAQVVEAAPAPQDEDDEPEEGGDGRRRRRRRRRGARSGDADDAQSDGQDDEEVQAAQPAQPAAPAPAVAAPVEEEDDDAEDADGQEDEGNDRRRRRRRRRGARSNDAPESATAPAAAPAAVASHAAAPRAAAPAVATPAPRPAPAPAAEPIAPTRSAAPAAATPAPKPTAAAAAAAAPEAEDAPRRRRRRRSLSDPLPEEPVVVEEDLEAALESLNAPKEMATLRLNIGDNRFTDEASVIDLLCELAGMDPEDFGAVVIKARSSQVDARHDMVDDIIEAVHGHVYEGLTLKVAITGR